MSLFNSHPLRSDGRASNRGAFYYYTVDCALESVCSCLSTLRFANSSELQKKGFCCAL